MKIDTPVREISYLHFLLEAKGKFRNVSYGQVSNPFRCATKSLTTKSRKRRLIKNTFSKRFCSCWAKISHRFEPPITITRPEVFFEVQNRQCATKITNSGLAWHLN